MTAVSPYAPPRRNSLLRRRSSSIEAGGGGGVGTAVVAVFLLALRFWRDVQYRETVRNFLRRRPTVFQWINKVFLFEKSGDKEQYGGHNDDDDDDATKEPILSKYVQKSSTLQEQSELDRIRENQQLIQKVLQFWFGQYTPDESQKNLWMIAHSSMSLRQRVDQEITEEFKTLLLELAGTTTILEEPTERWTEWCQDAIYGYQGKLAAIIVLDQFSRHMLRHFETNKLSLALPSKTHLDTWALKTAQILADQHSSEIRCGMIPLPMYIFSLMPFRHASTIESVELVQQQIEKCAGLSAQLDAMLGRFRKATNRRMAQLQDEARRSGQKKPTTTEDGSSPTNNVSDEDILETFPFDADMTPARNHPVVKIIQTFLVDRGLKPSKDGSHSGTATPIIISLSGGVDSMVIASVLACLHQSCGFHLNIWAVHIDYGNRPESSAEADFVRRYCEGLNISYKCRRIDEVTRGVTARDDYERIARDLRYTSYKETIALANEGFIGHDKIVTGVMLGHHRGDLRENVLSNAHKGCGPLDLSGMTAVSRNDGVDIYRPLLPLEKTSIFDYAHTFGVPYFKDTTPHWSTRGKLRNQLIPLLEEIYGEGSMKNLSNLAVESDECRVLLHDAVIGPFLEKIERRTMGIVFETAPWKDQALFFWKFVLRVALHSASFGMFSDKSVVSFLERVKATKLRSGWLQCRRDYAVYLQEDGRVYVLYPSSFPFAQKDMYDVVGQTLPYEQEKRVGPWVVKAEIISEKADCPETFRLAQKALPNMDYLMDGSIEYVIEAPTWMENGKFVPRPLVFTRFTKTSRPSAWKNNESNRNLYLKVQETLPLLGNDETAQAACANPTDNGCVDEVDGEKQVNPKRLVRVTLFRPER